MTNKNKETMKNKTKSIIRTQRPTKICYEKLIGGHDGLKRSRQLRPSTNPAEEHLRGINNRTIINQGTRIN